MPATHALAREFTSAETVAERKARHFGGRLSHNGTSDACDVACFVRAWSVAAYVLNRHTHTFDDDVMRGSSAGGPDVEGAPRRFGGRSSAGVPSGACGAVRPVLLWCTTRKAHNRRIDALHGNTSQAAPSSPQIL